MSKAFTHIYIEEKAEAYPLTAKILEKFPTSHKIYIKHYKDVFNRPSQNFQLQKEYKNLILAVKEHNFVYKGPGICQNFSHTEFFYTSVMLNCVYNCDYCFLQGMLPSANIVAFVNTDDFLDAAVKLEAGSYLTVSYDTDLLAFEGIIPYTSMWIGFASQNPGKLLEIRTKSSNYNLISGLRPLENVILAWTLSPSIVSKHYEKGAPSPEQRLTALAKAVEDGWKVRLCFDPLLEIPDWKKEYGALIDTVFASVPPHRIIDASVGAFRMNEDYFRKIKKNHPGSDILYHSFENREGVTAYPESKESELVEYACNLLSHYISKSKIYI